MPFITEEIWQKVKIHGGATIMLEPYPQADENAINKKIQKQFAYIQELVSSLRNIRAEMGISPAKEATVLIKTADPEELKALEENKAFVCNLAHIRDLLFGRDLVKPIQSGFRMAKSSEVYMELSGLLNQESELKKLDDQAAKIQKELIKINEKLMDEHFLMKAPPHILERDRRIQKEYQDMLDKILQNRKNFE
jgi:valyl-tRNA synthetase